MSNQALVAATEGAGRNVIEGRGRDSDGIPVRVVRGDYYPEAAGEE